MGISDSLRVDYATVPQLIELITYALEGISLDFDRWEEPFVSGPSLYFVIVSGTSTAAFTDALGRNRWPVQDCRLVSDDFDAFVEAARSVAFNCDGAVVVSGDGTVQRQMVRIKSPGPTGDTGPRELDDVETAEWMGTKHLSAAESSIREEVLAALTLSEEDGRVTVFEGGQFMDFKRDELGDLWRSGDD